MWNNYLIRDRFLKEKHFNLIKNFSFNTDGDAWEIYKHQIFPGNTVRVSYKNSLDGLSTAVPLTAATALDIHNTYHSSMLEYLNELAPEKVHKYKFTELNVVSTGKDYKFRIHNDTQDKLLSVVIYIAPDINEGTTLYSTEDGADPKQITWVPNRAFMFSRNNTTWHSYKADGVSSRLTLVYNLRG